jgi:hypothetical protein
MRYGVSSRPTVTVTVDSGPSNDSVNTVSCARHCACRYATPIDASSVVSSPTGEYSSRIVCSTSRIPSATF